MRVPNGYSYRPGRSQSPDTEWIFVPVDFGVPMAAHQAPPLRAMCAAAQKVSTLLTMVGCAALALERFDQRRLLPADVGTSADMDRDVEVEARAALDRGAEQVRFAAAPQHGFERVEQEAVFAAQVDQAAPRTDGQGGDRHAVEQQVGMAGQQHPVLEGPGLALVGVADDDVFVARCVAAELPLRAGGESGTAPAAQPGSGDLAAQRQRPARQRRGERRTGSQRCAEQHVGTAHLVVDAEPLGGPQRDRRVRVDQLGELVDALLVEAREHVVVVDQQRRPLVAETGAGGRRDADAPVRANFAGLHPQGAAQPLHQCLAAKQAVGDVVAEEHVPAAHRPKVEEAVEARHTLDHRKRQPEFACQVGQQRARQPAVRRLRLAQQLHERGRVAWEGGHRQGDRVSVDGDQT